MMIDPEACRRLRAILSGCREDMHEPDEQGVSAYCVGQVLDNANGHDVDRADCLDGRQELLIVISREGREHQAFNLATLLAMARAYAQEKLAETAPPGRTR